MRAWFGSWALWQLQQQAAPILPSHLSKHLPPPHFYWPELILMSWESRATTQKYRPVSLPGSHGVPYDQGLVVKEAEKLDQDGEEGGGDDSAESSS